MRLKLVATVAPIAVLTLVWMLLHTVFHEFHHYPYVLVVLAVTIVAVTLFAYLVFAVVEGLEERIVAQNRELEQRNEELAALLAVGRAASSSLALDEVLDGAMAAILDVTGAETAEVWLTGVDGSLVLARLQGAEQEAFSERTRLEPGEGLPGIAAELAAPVVVHDLPSDERFLRSAVKELGFRTFCALPLRYRHETLGVLGVASRDPGVLRSDGELRLLDGICGRVATAIENSRLHERVLDGAVVEERMRIARELHDGLAQVLGYINVQTNAVGKLLSSGQTAEAEAELAAMETAAREVYGDVREAILGLRVSLPREGLVPALRRFLDQYEPMSGTVLSLEADDEVEQLELPPEVEIQLVQIVQEAISNVRKHAGAGDAVVRLSADGTGLTVEVVDDGEGFDPGSVRSKGWPRFGLQTMRERAAAIGGRFEVDSRPGRGTRLAVQVPLGRKTRASAYARSAG